MCAMRKAAAVDVQRSGSSMQQMWHSCPSGGPFETASEKSNSRIVSHLLSYPLEDGGQWDMWVNLINKYGVLPQSEMSESFSTSQSSQMNKMISNKLREYASELRKSFKNGESLDKIREMKNIMIDEVFKMLSMHIGTPPQKFDWQVRNKDKKFLRFKNLTPQSFFNEHVGLKLDDYVCLINCPMNDKEYNVCNHKQIKLTKCH